MKVEEEGSEGDVDALSLALASGIGALSAPGTEGRWVGPAEKGAPQIFQQGTPSAQQYLAGKAELMDPGWLKSGTQALGTGSKYLTEAGTTLRNNPFNVAGMKASIVPLSQGTADLARITAEQELDRLMRS